MYLGEAWHGHATLLLLLLLLLLIIIIIVILVILKLLLFIITLVFVLQPIMDLATAAAWCQMAWYGMARRGTGLRENE